MLKRQSKVELISDEPLFLDSTRTKIVAKGDHRAASLLCPAGEPIPQKVIDRFKLDEKFETEELETAPVAAKVATDPAKREDRSIKAETLSKK